MKYSLYILIILEREDYADYSAYSCLIGLYYRAYLLESVLAISFTLSFYTYVFKVLDRIAILVVIRLSLYYKVFEIGRASCRERVCQYV